MQRKWVSSATSAECFDKGLPLALSFFVDGGKQNAVYLIEKSRYRSINDY